MSAAYQHSAHRMSRATRSLAAVGLALLLGCGGAKDTTNPDDPTKPPPVTSVVLAGMPAGSLYTGGYVQLTASPRDRIGGALADRVVA